jgi:hypothetical protein
MQVVGRLLYLMQWVLRAHAGQAHHSSLHLALVLGVCWYATGPKRPFLQAYMEPSCLLVVRLPLGIHAEHPVRGYVLQCS